MSAPFDALEHQLSTLRPSRLPAPARRRILREMERPAAKHGPASWLTGPHAGFQVALAGALSLALVVGWHWLPRPSRAVSRATPVTLAASNALLPSLVSWETRLAAVTPIGENCVAVLRSPSILTNIQLQR